MKNWWRTVEDYHRLPQTATDWLVLLHWTLKAISGMDGMDGYIPDSTNYKSTASGANKSKFIWQFSCTNCQKGKMSNTFWLWQFSLFPSSSSPAPLSRQTAVASLTSGQQAYIGLSDSATEVKIGKREKAKRFEHDEKWWKWKLGDLHKQGTFLWTDGSSLGSGFNPNWASNQPATSGSTAAANQVELFITKLLQKIWLNCFTQFTHKIRLNNFPPKWQQCIFFSVKKFHKYLIRKMY